MLLGRPGWCAGEARKWAWEREGRAGLGERRK